MSCRGFGLDGRSSTSRAGGCRFAWVPFWSMAWLAIRDRTSGAISASLPGWIETSPIEVFLRAGQRACSSAGQSTRLISVGSKVQILPGPFLRRRRACDGGGPRSGPRQEIPRRESWVGEGLSGLGLPGCLRGRSSAGEHLLCKQGVVGSIPTVSMARS